MEERWYPHVTVASIARQGDRYLMVRETYRGNTVINQPAGHIEKGESFEQAVIRETLEETGWEFFPQYVSGIYHFIAGNGETYLRLTYVGDVGRQLTTELDPTIDEALWLTRQEITNSGYNLRSQVVIRCIEDFEAGQNIPGECIKCL